MLVEGEFVPGFGKDCKDCSRSGLSYASSRFNCNEVSLAHDGITPIITKDKIRRNGLELTGDRKTCWGFVPTFATSLRDLASRAQAAISSIGIFWQ